MTLIMMQNGLEICIPQDSGYYGDKPTHQEYPLQLILDVLHAGKGSHSLDHLNKDAANSPGRQKTQNKVFF